VSRSGREAPSSRSRAPLTVAVLATISVAMVSALTPTSPTASASLFLSYVVCVTLCALWWLLRVMTPPSMRRDAMTDLRTGAPRAAAAPPPELFSLERLVDSTALDADWRLQRRLRELTAVLLNTRRGLALEPTSRELAAYAGLRGDRLLEPAERSRWEPLDPPLTVEELRRVIEHLEAI
jgi:hypothetical protein